MPGARSHLSAQSTSPAPRTGGWHLLPRIVVGLAVVMQLVVAVPFTVGMGLLAPVWALLVGWTLWLLAVGVLAATARRRPLVTPLVPFVNAVLLFAFVTFGGSVLGWTA